VTLSLFTQPNTVLTLVGVVLILIGSQGAVGACFTSKRVRRRRSPHTSARTEKDGVSGVNTSSAACHCSPLPYAVMRELLLRVHARTSTRSSSNSSLRRLALGVRADDERAVHMHRFCSRTTSACWCC
jgi:hypothetical protein